jgi:hypothetical protein
LKNISLLRHQYFMVFLMYQSTSIVYTYNKQINTTVLAFVYSVEVLLHVSTLSGHRQAIITWIYYSLLDYLPTRIQIGDFKFSFGWRYNFNY